MTLDAFHDLGREANNTLAAEFEDQLAAMSTSLGWSVVCRNIDVFVRHEGQSSSRGVDVLLAVEDPQLRRLEGYVAEGKRHEKPAYAAAVTEAQVLQDKVAGFNAQPAFWDNAHIRTRLQPPLRYGILAHRTNDFDPDEAASRRAGAEFKRTKSGGAVPVVHFLGPDMLEALATVVQNFGPSEWLWPPFVGHDAVWSTACPPLQLACGMVAFRDEAGVERLLLHDQIEHGDAQLLGDVLSAWGVNPTEILCTRARRERWNTIKDHWREEAAKTVNRPSGRLPETVQTRSLSQHLTQFDQQWPSDA